MVVVFEQKQPADPVESRPLLRDRQLFGHLVLELLKIDRRQIELADVRVVDVQVVERPERRQARPPDSRARARRESRGCAELSVSSFGERRRADLVEVGGIVQLEAGLHRQYLCVSERW
jgi:hypothetical protein